MGRSAVQTADTAELAELGDSARAGRAAAASRRRQLSQGMQALNGGGPLPPAEHHGNGAGAPPAASNGQGASNGAPRAPAGTDGATDGVAAAHLGRSLSRERRRQLSQGKQALTGGVAPAAAAAGGDAPAAAEGPQADGPGWGRELARARRAAASRVGSAGISRPQQEGRVKYPPKVVVSPTHRGQRVTGLGIGPGSRVTGGEPGAALPVSGSQYVAADGPAPASDAGTKVGMARTPKGLVVSGTMVRGTVPITGDEAGEHLRITGEADQKFYDDLTPRSDGTYRPAQFPRRADPRGATAVGTRLEPQPGVVRGGEGPWLPL
ncbi:MAG: CsoS2 family carboxysome shell protein, partial [Actinomycetes bacterium]